jgi:hypothetical protein
MMNQIRCYVGAGFQPARIFLLLFVFLLSAIALRADTHTATSCSQADVQAAIDAASDGDIVQVPPGTATWTTPGSMKPAIQIGKQLTWGQNPTFESKQITLQGAGIDKTVIIDETHQGFNENAILVFTVSGKPIRISGFTFKFGSDLKAEKGSIGISGTCKNWRIDHIKFDNPWKGNGIVAGYPENYGVVDHCVFITSTTQGNFKAFALAGNALYPDISWENPLSFGTENATYIEDCFLDYKMTYRCLDGASGARWVFRNNIVYNNTDVGTHGYDSAARSNISLEIYNNTFLHTISGDYYTLIAFRGGTGVIFNNTVQSTVGKWKGFIGLWYYCVCPGHPTCGHLPICTSYPCKDQEGRAPDSDHDGVQDLEPIYEWNNTVNINPHITVAQDCTQEKDFIQENRDYYNNTFRPSYVPYPYPHPLTLGDYPGQQHSLDLVATPADGQISLSWKAVTGAVSYSILRNWQQVVLVTGTSWSEIPPSGQHVYMVYALDGSSKILAAEGKLISAITQNISLTPGWNWVSFNVLPDDLSLNSVFNGILPQVEQVKTQTQSAVRSGGNWKGDLANMTGIGQYKMYKVKVNAACTLTVTGSAIFSTMSIPLVTGWNWVAYLPTTAMPIATALASISGQVQEVKSLTQSATYSGGAWTGTLTQLDPGQGYAIKMSVAGTLTYPAGH